MGYRVNKEKEEQKEAMEWRRTEANGEDDPEEFVPRRNGHGRGESSKTSETTSKGG